MARRKSKQKVSLLEEALLAIKNTPDKVPDELINAEKVTQQLTGKKLKLTKRWSYKLKSTIRNCKNATTRLKRAETLLIKHYKALLKLNKQIQSLKH